MFPASLWRIESRVWADEPDRKQLLRAAQTHRGNPNAANTHPETYPNYQVQLQRVALLRNMINWCIQHPTKGKPLADDQRLRAMEAYMMAQRKGKAIEPGKH